MTGNKPQRDCGLEGGAFLVVLTRLGILSSAQNGVFLHALREGCFEIEGKGFAPSTGAPGRQPEGVW